MAISLRTTEEIYLMRAAGKIAADVLVMIEPHVKAGITTGELDDICQEYILSQGATSACLGYHGYPKCVCISVNEEVCHGIPGKRRLHDGDILNIDVTVIKDGFEIHNGHPTFDKTWTDPVNAQAFAQELIKHTYREGWALPAMPK